MTPLSEEVGKALKKIGDAIDRVDDIQRPASVPSSAGPLAAPL